MTCRFCGVQDPKAGKLVKYAARHWAHYHCWIETKGREIADPTKAQEVIALLSDAFHGWQLRNWPVFVFAEWVERKGTKASGKTWVDKAMNILKTAIERSEAGLTREERREAAQKAEVSR